MKVQIQIRVSLDAALARGTTTYGDSEVPLTDAMLASLPPDARALLVCRQCNGLGFGHRLESYVFGPPHSEERCDYCAGVLGNRGEP